LSLTLLFKEIDARFFRKLLQQFPVLACTFLSVFSMNFLVPCLSASGLKNPLVSERDCKGTTFF